MTNETLLKIIDWSTGDDTGSSSTALCRYMLGLLPNEFGFSSPHDSADRGRCIRLLNIVPEWWDRLDEMESITSHTVTFWGKGQLQSREDGWKEQIPFIRKEANHD